MLTWSIDNRRVIYAWREQIAGMRKSFRGQSNLQKLRDVLPLILAPILSSKWYTLHDDRCITHQGTGIP